LERYSLTCHHYSLYCLLYSKYNYCDDTCFPKHPFHSPFPVHRPQKELMSGIHASAGGKIVAHRAVRRHVGEEEPDDAPVWSGIGDLPQAVFNSAGRDMTMRLASWAAGKRGR
jgi:hypothetical protein